MKKYILLAGVNGSGKSTLYETLENLKDMPRINTDEIVKEIGDWRDTDVLVKSGKKRLSCLGIILSNTLPKWIEGKGIL